MGPPGKCGAAPWARDETAVCFPLGQGLFRVVRARVKLWAGSAREERPAVCFGPGPGTFPRGAGCGVRAAARSLRIRLGRAENNLEGVRGLALVPSTPPRRGSLEPSRAEFGWL